MLRNTFIHQDRWRVIHALNERLEVCEGDENQSKENGSDAQARERSKARFGGDKVHPIKFKAYPRSRQAKEERMQNIPSKIKKTWARVSIQNLHVILN